MNQDFPFGQFLKSNNENQSSNSHNNNKNLKEFKLENINTSPNKEPEEAQIQPSGDFSAEELNILNQELLNHVQTQVTPEKYNAFFDGSFNLTNITMDSVHFAVTTNFIKTMIQNHYKGIITNGIFQVLGKEFQVIVDVIGVNQVKQNSPKQNENINLSQFLETNETNETPKTQIRSVSEAKFTLDLNPTQDDLLSKVESQYIDHMNPEDTGVIIDPKKIFDNFIVGPSNNLACASAVAITNQPGNKGKYPSLYIHSDSGLGKTHLLHSVANGIRENYPQYVVCLITARDFMKEMINAIQNRTLPDFQKKYSEKVDVLMIDDIHELKNKTGTQNEFFHVFNELYNKGKQLIFTSDKQPEEIEGLEERIKTRLQWGLVVDIQKPDLETRIAILRRKAYELDLYLPDDIINLIALSIKNSIRELEGALIKLSAFSDVMKVEIDTEMVKDLLMLKGGEESKKITLDHIAKATANYFKIHVADLKSKARQKEIANARFIAMYLSRKMLNVTQQEIGKFYGGRDHSSVVHAEKEVIKRMATDINMSRDVIAVENNI